MATSHDQLRPRAQQPRLFTVAACRLGFSLFLLGSATSAAAASEANCSLTVLQNALAEGSAIEGNISLLSAAVSAGGSFTPPGATAPMTNVPGFCRVIGVARPSSDSHISFEVWLPTAGWNNRYLSVGEGGLHGRINYTGLVAGVGRGYATASTDAGHSAADRWWMVGHPEKVTDAGHRGKHLQTVAAKAVISAYYDEAPKRSYHTGCSGGGRQGLMSLQRYPDDFDGYVIGAPANNWTGQTTNWINKGLALTDPASVIPATKLPAIQAAVRAQCDKVDGLTDGVISDPRRCQLDLDVLACEAGKEATPVCLTQPQLGALKRIYRGPVDSAGRQLFPGEEAGTDIIAATGPNYVDGFGTATMSGLVHNRSDWDFKTFSFDRDPQVMEEKIGKIFNANDANLRAQKAKGIKVIQYHGWVDQALSPGESIRYYERVMAQIGNLKQTQDFYRLFMAPGMAHCSGGPGPNSFGQSGGESVRPPLPMSTASGDVLKALERWVEEGVAPDELVATKYTNDVITEPALTRRPLCPYPQVQTYNGSGDPNVASSFSCGAR